MGILNFFSKSAAPNLMRLPAGSFTVDRTGRIIASTLPQTFTEAHGSEIGHAVLAAFRLAQDAQMPLTEITLAYAALKLTARELRGGAIVFLSSVGLKQK